MWRYLSKVHFLSSVIIICGCLNADTTIQSVFTSLNVSLCDTKIDQEDPNHTAYEICPGVSGYTLLVRYVGSGRQSIDIITPLHKAFSLDYHLSVTRHMFHLGEKAEWRVLIKNKKKMPIALIVPVHVHGNYDDPVQTTHTYLVLAKITSEKSCITDTILANSLSQTALHKIADSAQTRTCLQYSPEN